MCSWLGGVCGGSAAKEKKKPTVKQGFTAHWRTKSEEFPQTSINIERNTIPDGGNGAALG